jgi:hypothetical protein
MANLLPAFVVGYFFVMINDGPVAHAKDKDNSPIAV